MTTRAEGLALLTAAAGVEAGLSRRTPLNVRLVYVEARLAMTGAMSGWRAAWLAMWAWVGSAAAGNVVLAGSCPVCGSASGTVLGLSLYCDDCANARVPEGA